MRNYCDGNVDIPDGMDRADARVAIKLLYGADQTYRSALRDFAKYDGTKTDLCGEGEGIESGVMASRTNKKESVASSTRRKRLRRSATEIDNKSKSGNDRSGRITHLHVTGIASIFLPSWDLCFVDIVKLDKLMCLELDGCDSVPSEVFFELPNLTSLCLINCQELTDPISCIASHKYSQNTDSTIEKLDIRGGGLWGMDFLSALRLLLPWMSRTLVSLRLSHTPYASCYNNNYNSKSVYGNGSAGETSERMMQERLEAKLLQETRFHETMGGLLLDALLSLARGRTSDDINRGTTNDINTGGECLVRSSPLEDLSLSFFNSLLDRDLSSLLLDVVPEFSNLTTLHLPHHTISNLKIASIRISTKRKECEIQPRRHLPPPSDIPRSSCLSWRISCTDRRQSSNVSLSRLRRLWLKPTLKHRSNTEKNQGEDNQEEKKILSQLLSHFPELGCVARSSNHKGYLYSPCPYCCGQYWSTTKSPHLDRTIEYLLRINHSGRCLLEGLDEGVRRPCPLSVWPLVLERAWKAPPPDFCASNQASNASAIFYLLREGSILSNRRIS